MKDKDNRGIRRIINAFRYSFAGYKAAWKNEEAFRQECIIAIFVIPAGLWLGRTGTQRALLIGVYIVIPLIELLNASIEAIVDRMGPEQHLLSGRAKDLGSAAVLLSIVMSMVVWGLIAYERFFS
jgi:diacylglycerol kinase (ATP)